MIRNFVSGRNGRRDGWLFLIPVTLILLAAFDCTQAFAQKKTAGSKLNKAFENPNVDRFVKNFERESRDVYAKRHEVLKACGIGEGMVIADIGAGTGLYTRLFGNKVGTTGRIYAVDISKKFVDHILETCKSENLTNVEGVVCKPDSVELSPKSIDVAFICDTYHHFEYPKKTTETIWSALRPGGTLYLIEFKKIKGVSPEWVMGHVRGDEKEFTKEIEGVGFERVGQFDLFDDKYFLKFRKKDNVKPAK